MASYYEISMAGSVLVYLSTLGFIIAALYAIDLQEKAFAMGALALVATMGLMLNAFTASIVSFLTIFIGICLFVVGMILFAASSFWQGALLDGDNFEGVERPGYIAFVAQLTILGGLVPILLKARQLFKRPVIGPHNMLSCIALSFFGGAVCFLVVAIEASGWVCLNMLT